jgi:hypothetical protein
VEFIGIDVHKRESQVCIVAAGGEVVLELRIPTIVIRRSDPSRSGAKPMWLDQVVAESSFRREGPFSTSL